MVQSVFQIFSPLKLYLKCHIVTLHSRLHTAVQWHAVTSSVLKNNAACQPFSALYQSYHVNGVFDVNGTFVFYVPSG